ncbi:MAG: hypothetical protein WD872_06185 [Pirellulaceae bacterium]
MPIRFACPHCRQKLSISTRKAGQTADCPRCKAALTIPQPAEPEPVSAGGASALAIESSAISFTGLPSAEEDSSPPPADESRAWPAIADADQLELVYDATDENPPDVPAAEPADMIAVPRYVLYLQGGLLAVVALASFAIGLLAGSAFSGGNSAPREPQACLLEGTIHVVSGDRDLPDSGAVVAVIPDRQTRPAERAPAIGLRPEDSTPVAANRGVAILRELGGGYARTDERGHFQIRVPDRGQYLVLVISQARQLKSLDEISTADLLKLSPFFDNAADLLGRQQYRLTSETVRGDRQLEVVFD